jgi:ABC-type xylose transport system permease subunit
MKSNEREFTMQERMTMPVPKFFKKVRNVGLLLGAIGGAILGAPIALPAGIVTIAGYLVTAGLVSSAVSSVAVRHDR